MPRQRLATLPYRGLKETAHGVALGEGEAEGDLLLDLEGDAVRLLDLDVDDVGDLLLEGEGNRLSGRMGKGRECWVKEICCPKAKRRDST